MQDLKRQPRPRADTVQAHKPRTAQCIPIQNSPGQATATGAMQARNRWPQPHPNGYFRGGGQQGLKYYGDLLAKRDSASPADREGSSLGLWWWGGGAVLRKAYRQSTSLVESCAVLRARAGATACSCSWRPPSLLSRTVSHAQSVHCMKRGTVGSGQPQSSQQW